VRYQASIVLVRAVHKTYGVSWRWPTLMHSDEIYSELRAIKSSDENRH
jgi:hypothetical protein